MDMLVSKSTALRSERVSQNIDSVPKGAHAGLKSGGRLNSFGSGGADCVESGVWTKKALH